LVSAIFYNSYDANRVRFLSSDNQKEIFSYTEIPTKLLIGFVMCASTSGVFLSLLIQNYSFFKNLQSDYQIFQGYEVLLGQVFS